MSFHSIPIISKNLEIRALVKKQFIGKNYKVAAAIIVLFDDIWLESGGRVNRGKSGKKSET